ncbi:MAG: hypothetical protein C0428_04080 [Polaromonas sp.]|uniref:DUF1003 domain-containing protein n=1 Tax=Polaromonas sp. TaxID=1869339 RepID=UPI004036A005|nr:hypothetical protein [Polaromonas sp.]
MQLAGPAAGSRPGQAPRRAAPASESIEELTRSNIEAILQLERERQARRPWAYRLAASIAGFCGTAPVLWLHAVFFISWLAFNASPLAFDPYPFTFLTMVVSLEAIFLSFFIMIGQNIASRENERRHQLDLQINLLNEREMTAMLRLMGKVADKLQISAADQAEARTFAHNTDPLALLDQIVSAERAARQSS